MPRTAAKPCCLRDLLGHAFDEAAEEAASELCDVFEMLDAAEFVLTDGRRLRLVTRDWLIEELVRVEHGTKVPTYRWVRLTEVAGCKVVSHTLSEM